MLKNRLLLIILTFLVVLLIANCSSKKMQLNNTWPKHRIFSTTGDMFELEKCEKDTMCFRMQATAPDMKSFLDSGRLYLSQDTVFYQHWASESFSPFFILKAQEKDTLVLRQVLKLSNPFEPEAGKMDFVLNATIHKQKNYDLEKDEVSVFDIYSSHISSKLMRVVLSKEQGILGIWFLFDGSEALEGLYVSGGGLGWFPDGFIQSRID